MKPTKFVCFLTPITLSLCFSCEENHLVGELWWDELAQLIDINCFKSNPSIKSCLKFLRKTPWAREKVEQLYLDYEH